ncbi:MAG: ATP-binding cassette domain-containing protein [Eubacterium sp.]|nr:ATP-binding cassette domain-containing protein [Candidatus Colimonas fimequi]
MGLEVRIKKKLGNFQLDVSFTCDNTVTAILGPSGCGKSMTLKCIAGVETPDEGRIVLNDRVLFDSEKKINLPPQKRHVGYMFQDYALFPNMTVRQNIEIALGGKKVDEMVFQRFHLSHVTELYPAQLSGGQKQRTAMARMLVTEPELIMLDEPFSALDADLKGQIEKEVKQILQAENKPTLFVSHDRDEVNRLCQYTGVMADGMLEGVDKTNVASISQCRNKTKAVRVDTYKVFLPELGIEIETSQPVPWQEGYIGVKTEDLLFLEDKE